ncbi:hypothetical protein B0T26DRAFT_671922 [Lasiosphaeria miniovina]|uniref:Uncharacterized protein n=1 Tax=Lasiosphaeria miniovina TaxID=1954250 RepID=A0AA40B3X2_9PEZI|nr:uncharacterized protein B0T26DRAFT_671922 [Lasiosphaeria miniovina]KAK0727228.1 hypothetical protein B0T26DRAFT_671922 [Lasiosphaeria miniovina]
MLRDALELGILSERTEAIWRKSLLEIAYHEALQEVRLHKVLLSESDSDLETSGEECEDDYKSCSNTILPALRTDSVQVSQHTKTGSGIGSPKEEEKEERLLTEQSKHDDGHEEQKGLPEGREKGKQKISISTDKDKGTDHGEGETFTLTRKLSKLSPKGSYRRLKEVPGKFKRSRVASFFHKPKEEERVREQE